MRESESEKDREEEGRGRGGLSREGKTKALCKLIGNTKYEKATGMELGAGIKVKSRLHG